ncbi:MAG: hypothetical protein DDT21_00114 [Syntrophomonadaceae bacterium]|nr:hypothetical protein [Bacillota bacterium]
MRKALKDRGFLAFMALVAGVTAAAVYILFTV